VFPYQQFPKLLIALHAVPSLQEKATIHGEFQTLETTLFLKKANVPLYVGKMLMQGRHIFADQ
jgi:hypothetical protein